MSKDCTKWLTPQRLADLDWFADDGTEILELATISIAEYEANPRQHFDTMPDIPENREWFTAQQLEKYPELTSCDISNDTFLGKVNPVRLFVGNKKAADNTALFIIIAVFIYWLYKRYKK